MVDARYIEIKKDNRGIDDDNSSGPKLSVYTRQVCGIALHIKCP